MFFSHILKLFCYFHVIFFIVHSNSEREVFVNNQNVERAPLSNVKREYLDNLYKNQVESALRPTPSNENNTKKVNGIAEVVTYIIAFKFFSPVIKKLLNLYNFVLLILLSRYIFSRCILLCLITRVNQSEFRIRYVHISVNFLYESIET